ncbi:MAG TPA: hypothetical protein VKZ86_01950 [Cyclobacteriaceae bacterium]|nr:hypothetical protein [Cyclobacteriaceae bacterium]
MRNHKFSLLLLICFFCGADATAQNQLLLLKNQDVLLRLRAGDNFAFRVKGSKEVRRTYINALSDTAVVTQRDTVPFRIIDRVYFRSETFVHRLGLFLMIGGIGYFAVDQLNTVVVHGEDARLDRDVTTASLVMLAAGVPMRYIGRNSRKVRGRVRLLMATPESPFYRDTAPRGYESPYIPR